MSYLYIYIALVIAFFTGFVLGAALATSDRDEY